jgi:beta-phosphoglucomutase-like phosphatase (HAD superfamily)
MIRTVFFDLDDTLVRSAPAWHSGVEAAFARLRERRPELGHKAIEAAWQSTNRALRMQLEAGMLIVAQVRALRWPATLKALGIRDDSLASDLETTLAETFIGGLQLFDDADVLDRLRCRLDTARPYHVGIITNGATDRRSIASTPKRVAWDCSIEWIRFWHQMRRDTASPIRASSPWRWSVPAPRHMRRSTSATPSATTWWGQTAPG